MSCTSMVGVFVFIAFASFTDGVSAARGSYGGYSGHRGFTSYGQALYSQSKKCKREVETITTKWCKLEYEKTCTTETKAFTKITGYERGDCKEVKFCKPDYGKYGNVVTEK